MRRLTTIIAAFALLLAGCGDDDTGAAGATSTTGAATTTTATTAATSTSTEATVATTLASEADCPTADFLLDEVNSYQQDGYPDPELAVTCAGSTMTVTTNDIPNFEFVQMTPNGLQAQNFTFQITLDPVEANTPGAIGLGPIGVSVNGLTLFGAFEAPQDGYQDPYLDGLLDFCNGHTAQGGLYHFHARFDCVFDDPTTPGLVLGYMFDGYELVSPWVCVDDACTSTRMVESSYQRIDPNGLGAFDAWEYVAGSGDLDECNGMTGDDGVYRYYATDEFPYLAFCYHGQTDRSQGDFVGEAPAGGVLPPP